MKLPDRFIITLIGTVHDFRSRSVVGEGFATPWEALLEGGECPDEVFRPWGLRLIIEENVDYGDLRRQDEEGMCNRYRVRTGPEEIANLFRAEVTKDVRWGNDIWPRYEAPIIIAHEGTRRIGPMRWGFPTQVQGKTKPLIKHVTNARNLDSSLWKPSIMRPERRCLVPFTSFAEPKPGKDENGLPAQHWFTIVDQPVAAFAGLWRPTEDGPVFAFLTCEPNALVAPLHPKAMPVVLMADDHEKWLTGTYEQALAMQTSYPSQLMSIC